MMGLVTAPFSFRRLRTHEAVVITNQLGAWEFMRSVNQVNTLIDSPEECEGLDRLLAKGFVSGANGLETYARAAEVQLTTRYLRAIGSPSLIMVVPTLRCDHSCSYCQVSRAPLSSSRHDISVDVQQIARFIDQVASKNFKLEFQGGEPLLRFDWLRELVHEVRALRGDGFDVVICSALGPPLEQRLINWAEREKASFSISFDGHIDIHAKIRLHESSDDSAQSTLDKAKVLKAAGISVSFVSTLTREAIARGATSYVHACLDAGISRLFSRPLSDFGFATTTKRVLGYDVDQYLQFFEKLLDEQISRFDSATPFVDDSIVLRLEKLYRPLSSGYVDAMSPAGYGLSACLINYDGQVFGSDEARMLYESTGATELALGVLTERGFTDSHSQVHEEILKSSFLEVQPHCSTCAYLPFCGLDPITTLREQGDIVGNKPTLSQCRLTLGIYDAIFERIHNGSLTSEMVSSWISKY